MDVAEFSDETTCLFAMSFRSRRGVVGGSSGAILFGLRIGQLNHETQVDLDVLPASFRFSVFGGTAIGFVKLGFLAQRARGQGIVTYEFGNAVDILVKVGNISGIGMGKATMPQCTHLFSGEDIDRTRGRGTCGMGSVGGHECGIIEWKIWAGAFGIRGGNQGISEE